MTEKAGAGSLTGYVADFIASTRFASIPEEVVALGKKSILDGLGLALAGCGGGAKDEHAGEKKEEFVRLACRIDATARRAGASASGCSCAAGCRTMRAGSTPWRAATTSK